MSRAEKRRRPSSARCLRSQEAGPSQPQPSTSSSSSHNLESLPPEVLEMVFRFLSYRDLAVHVRLVSRKCAWVSTMILNSGFLSAGARMRACMERLSEGPPANECEAMARSRARESLEFVKAQYELVRAVVWRYTHPPRRQKFVRLCFYGGAILDQLDRLLSAARNYPAILSEKDGPAHCILSFGATCKAFMNYFEKVSERRVNNKSTYVSGCKLVDVLDCLLEGRQLLHYRVSSGRAGRGSTVSMRLRYVIERAWFTCLEVPRPDENDGSEDSWCDQQRFMYLRLRRLVASSNEHQLERLYYERELLMNKNYFRPAPKPPTSSTYSGYGEFSGRFFYYGNMNEYAYESKIVDEWRRNSARNRLRRKTTEDRPNYDLIINVELKCSPELAPLAVRSSLKCDDFENSTLINNSRPELYLRLSIFCPASISNKLPGNFVWELRSPRRRKTNA